MDNYYDILEIPKAATEDEIKKAYRKLAIKYHPDKNPDDFSATERFREITEAYDILKDPIKRSQYDLHGLEAFKRHGQGYKNPDINLTDIINKFATEFATDDEIANIFGFGKKYPDEEKVIRTRSYIRGADVRITVPLTLEEMCKGTSKTIRINRKAHCPDCGGYGSKTKRKRCENCRGSGYISMESGGWLLGKVFSEMRCPKCDGLGQILVNPCKKCNGKGVVETKIEKNLTFQPGSIPYTQITFKNLGDVGEHNGYVGDLIINTSEITHPKFVRDGLDIICEKTISFSEAALGASIEVEGMNERLVFKIPSGTQTGATFKLRNKGIPIILVKKNEKDQNGHLLVKIKVKTPEGLSREGLEAMEALRKAGY
jgi:molecular chaperone DnaJ